MKEIRYLEMAGREPLNLREMQYFQEIVSARADERAYLDPKRFASFRIEYGELVWGDYDLCFPIMDLHRNDLSHGMAQAAA